MTSLLKYFGSHVSWRAAGRRQNMKGFLVHDPRQPKIGYQKVRIVFRRAEK